MASLIQDTSVSAGGKNALKFDLRCVEGERKHDILISRYKLGDFFYLVGKDYNPCFAKRYTTGYLQYYVQS
jgi:hypothetical protein